MTISIVTDNSKDVFACFVHKFCNTKGTTFLISYVSLNCVLLNEVIR